MTITDLLLNHMAVAQIMLAQTSKPADPQAWWFPLINNPFLFVGVAVIALMFFSGKGKRGEEKARQEMLKQLKRGDRIQTIGGIQGAVTRAEEARVEVKVDEASNTKIWFARSAIARVLEADKADKADKSEKAEAK